MKRATKVLVLLLIAVFLLGVFSGCGLFGRNTDKYRATTAFTVGDEKITIGKLIDTYNNYYNTYYSYITQGYITADYVLELAMDALYTQYMKVDAYKNIEGVPTYTHAGTNFANQEYLSDEEYAFTLRYIKYVIFGGLDSVVESYASADYTLAAEEEEDTSRDFVEYDDLTGCDTYSEYVYMQNFVNEEMDEYFEKYYNGIITEDVSIDEYVYANAEEAQSRLDALNARIETEEGEEKVTISFETYKGWQEKALKQYKDNVMRTYDYDVDTLIQRQTEDYILSLIATKYDYTVYAAIDGEDLSATVEELQRTYEELRDNQAAGFNINNNFVSFIESLTDTSFILDVPDGYNYVFVKNILIPFTEEQKTVLSNLQKQLGSDTDPRYIAKRTEFAAAAVAEDFLHQDEDGENLKVENVFKMEGDSVVINPDGALGAYLAADGSVVPMEGKTATETIIELMKQYNTDTASHAAIYDYVVRVGEVPENYTAKWVDEFVDATNAAYDLAVAAGTDSGYYAIGVSSYGVHIVYLSGKVKAQVMDFNANLFNSASPEYRMYKTYFDTQSSKLLEDSLEALKEQYYNGKIVKTKEFDKFLKESDLIFDFEASLDLSEEEE